ncbi:OST-HTH/LOTUS domain-containing protein [Microbacterium sp. LRZ72]|uniref:OST-HTH/LOTUS domain-containing protein n=1 Tax=Microbacterium sp. LRZ72 TaxID=2942481 RepID=UPI0029BE2ACE|nr:OST-HTH/LOTUS domain-containing protein [Microbacterium sp. LRZ72]MDX2377221.1 OST-HTH/LOTUS domain-containing protein [Microbacterium sp. LRZ72]
MKVPAATLQKDAVLATLLRSSVDAASAEDGWANLSTAGQLVRKQQPDFDSRNWGYAKFTDLLKAVDIFVIETGSGVGRVRLR